MIASKGDPLMYNRQGKGPGWAAFDQQQKHKDAVDGRVSNDPFPSLSGPMAFFDKPERVSGNKTLPLKPFSSVVVPSVDFLDNKSMQSEVGNTGGHRTETSGDGNFDTVFRRLKEQYSWADGGLIEDIMVSVDSDLNLASSFLKAMVSDKMMGDHKCHDSMSNARSSFEKSENYAKNVQTVYEPPNTCSFLERCTDNGKEVRNNNFLGHDAQFADDLMSINAMLGQLTRVPVEPEWEEDDVYLSCRKDALKMMRAAARDSKAATNSFQRGDHYSAQQFSLKAKEEWESANRLNAEAARQILSIQNESNGIWRLDLHGLHASEAVQALQEHLRMIETQLYFKGSSSTSLPNGSWTKAEVVHTSSSSGDNKVLKFGEQALCRPDLKWLEVITGIGKHSRGGAALPTAVRTFLVDNRYRIDEARPGVIMVRPKLRSS